MTDYVSKLHDAISSKQAIIGIVGLGYVGLPLASALHSGGLTILGFDVDESKIASLEQGRNYLKHLGSDLTINLSKSDRFNATADFSRLQEIDVVIVCVPTPVGEHLEPDLYYVLETARAIGKALKPGQLVILESTTYPGTTNDEFLPVILQAAKHAGRASLTVGKELFVAFSPEREDPGRQSHSTTTTPKLVGGVEPVSTELAAAVYQTCVETVVKVASAEIAEAAKILENVFRSVNIAMINELKILFDEMDIDVWEVINAASTKPFGFMPFYPGAGAGGHCIPKDPRFLLDVAKKSGVEFSTIENALQINFEIPKYICKSIERSLEKLNCGKSVLVCGLSYKLDVEDMRDSPGFKLLLEFKKNGFKVSAYDPFFKKELLSKYLKENSLESLDFEQKNDLNDNSLSKIDCLCIVQHHTNTKSRLSEIYEKSLVPFIYDCQSKFEKISGAETYLDSLGS